MNYRKAGLSLLFIVVLFAIAIGLNHFFSSQKELPANRKSQEFILYVHADTALYHSHPVRLQADGRIIAGDRVNLGAQMQGELLQGEVELRAGVSFRKGQLLARIFNENAMYSLKAQKSRFINAVASILPDLKVDFPERYQTYLQFFESLDVEGRMTELPEAKSNKETVFLAGRGVLNDYYSIRSQEVQMQKYLLYAPFDGAFTDVNMEVGSIVNPGSVIATMIHTRELELAVPVSTEDIYLVKTGDQADVLVSATGERINGRVNRIADYVDQASQSVNVYLELSSSSDVKMFQGQYFQVEFNARQIDSCILIPRNALSDDNHVFVVRDSLLNTELVEVLYRMDKTALIRGPEEGIMLVSEPLVNPQPGTKTHILN